MIALEDKITILNVITNNNNNNKYYTVFNIIVIFFYRALHTFVHSSISPTHYK